MHLSFVIIDIMDAFFTDTISEFNFFTLEITFLI